MMCSGHKAVFALAIAGTLGVSGCASYPQDIIGRSDLSVAQIEATGADIMEVYVATTRAFDDDGAILFSGERARSLNFAKVQVSIPPNHQPGMIERPSTIRPDPSTEFTITNPVELPTPENLVSSIDASLAEKPGNEQDVLVFVHGYNTDLTSAILRTAQFAYDINYPGVPLLFSWASSGRTFDYVYDLNSALHARDALLETGEILSETDADGFNVMAHSMGSLLTVEAMRQAVLATGGEAPDQFRVKNVALAAPDIDLDLFRKQLDVLPTTDIPIYILTSKDDRALAISSRIAGQRTRVGAADAEQLADLGVIVVDLSEVEDRDSISHTKFANSPTAIQVIGEGLRAGNTLETRTDTGFRVLDIVGLPGRVVDGGARILVEE